ncbi:retrovirus-related pol polyprotein from transposon TNT 1-94 [Tanacetum coccineum]
MVMASSIKPLELRYHHDLQEKTMLELTRLKIEKIIYVLSLSIRKSKKQVPTKPKTENTNLEVSKHPSMDLCGTMRVQTIMGRNYILSSSMINLGFTWVKFLRPKIETPALSQISDRQIPSRFSTKQLFQEDSTSRTKTLSKEGTVLLSRRLCDGQCNFFSKARDVSWAEAVATACYTQNRSRLFTHVTEKTTYELVQNDKKPDLTVFPSLWCSCYPTNDSENLGKLQPTADIGIFVGYAPNRKGYRIYNKRTRQIMETIHVTFDELTEQMGSCNIQFQDPPPSC